MKFSFRGRVILVIESMRQKLGHVVAVVYLVDT